MAVATAIAAEVTGVIRDIGTGVESHGRALGSTVRSLAVAAGMASVALLHSGAHSTQPESSPPRPVCPPNEPRIVDKWLTRC